MKKTVDIVANIPVRSVRPMVYGNIKNAEMDTEDIFKCICGRAIVDEILRDGSLLRLDLNNYNTVNEAEVDPTMAAIETVVETETEVAVQDDEETVNTIALSDTVIVTEETAVPVEAEVETPVTEETVEPVVEAESTEATVTVDEPVTTDTAPVKKNKK